MHTLHNLGATRSTRKATHLLHTSDAFVRIPLPGLVGGDAVVHAAPALGAAFLQYSVTLEHEGKLMPGPNQRFLYVLEGEAAVSELEQDVHAGDFVYMPPTQPTTLIASSRCRCAVIEKKYEPLAGVQAPPAFVGAESAIAGQALEGDPDVVVRALLPADFGFDFAVNTMTYAPGAALSQVEVHVMEHGLLMLEGGGIYKLAEDWYPVTAGDFIWMAPFCPQWFAAVGKGPAKYLIYRDFNRVPVL
jgi:(S)-ureidoglycine aminohydrolase